MALPPLAEVAEMETRLRLDVGSLADADLAFAEAALTDASNLVRAEGLDWVADDGVTITAPDVVVTVVVNAALRAFRNPDNYQGESVGDYSWQAAPGSTGVYLLDEEVRVVRRAAKKTDRAYSVRTPSAYEAPASDSFSLSWGL